MCLKKTRLIFPVRGNTFFICFDSGACARKFLYQQRSEYWYYQARFPDYDQSFKQPTMTDEMVT